MIDSTGCSLLLSADFVEIDTLQFDFAVSTMEICADSTLSFSHTINSSSPIDSIRWNFIGGKDGSHIDGETLEVTRIYKRLSDKKKAGETLSEEEEALLEKVRTEVEGTVNALKPRLETANKDKTSLAEYKATLTAKGVELTYTSVKELEQLTSEDEVVLEIKEKLTGTGKVYVMHKIVFLTH